MYSLERRRERYRIMYTWKILEGWLPNLTDPITTKYSERVGRLCIIPSKQAKASSAIQTQKFNSFRIHGARLFNKMPKEICNITNCEPTFFKRNLDTFLSLVPDEPLVAGVNRRCMSNSILEMTNYINPDDILKAHYSNISPTTLTTHHHISNLLCVLYYALVFVNFYFTLAGFIILFDSYFTFAGVNILLLSRRVFKLPAR